MSAIALTPAWLAANEAALSTVLGNLMALVGEAGDSHIVTSSHDGAESSSSIHFRGDAPEVEHEDVILAIAIKAVRGEQFPLIVRTFENEISHHAQKGAPIPFKTVRGWFYDGSVLQPLTEVHMFDAHCTDHVTGDPIPPERGVRYADAWTVDIHAPYEPEDDD